MSAPDKKDGTSGFGAMAAKWGPILLIILFAFYGLSKLRPQKIDGDFDLATFGKLPVQAKGRVKPLDTVARNALLVMRGKQTVPDGPEVSFYEKVFEGEKAPKYLTAIEWFARLALLPNNESDDLRVFRIDHPEVLGLFGFKPGSAKYFSFNELFEADKRRALEQKMRNALMPENERLLNQRQNVLNEFNAFAQENPDATEKENNATFELLRSRYQEAEDEIEEFHELIQLEKTRWMFANQRFHTSKAAAEVAWDDVQAARDARLEKIAPGYLEAKKEFDAITARVMNIQRTARAIHVGEDLNENDRLDPGEDLNRNGELDKGPNPKKLTPFQRNLGKFASAFSLYRQLKNSLYPQEMSDLFGPAYEYETSVYNLAKNLQDHGVSKGFPDALNTLARLPDYMMESMPPEAQDAIGNFSLAAQYLKSASPLGIIPPASFAGKITILNDSRTLSASEGNLTAFLEPQDQVKIGSFSTFRGIWRENQLREKLIQSVDKPDSLTLTNPHQGRSPLVDAAAYLLIVSVAFGIFRGLRRKRKPQIAIGAGAMVFALLSCLWIILFGTPSATIEDATLHHIDWTTLPESILDSRGQGEKPDPDKMGEINPYAQGYAELALAYQMNNSTKFNEIVGKLDQDFAAVGPSQWHDFKNIKPEQLFNGAQPFVNCMALYLVSLILVFLSWLFWPEPLRKSAFGIAAVALILHSIALVARIWIQGRPPVTNLYSSAIFISWGAVCFGLIFERIHRNGIGSAAAGIVGFVSLVIAHGLAMDGDTMEMLQAVLDTNLWLATHVVCITFGYVAMFVAGILGIIYVVRGILDRNFDKAAARSIGSMIYGVTCFAVLFSFVGTMLGGIWADQSWGRFWGWDPKENGAILIVIWSAILLHARWGGIAKTRGLVALAIFGNVVTAWSWFGTNLLQEGLHSYGFSDAGFIWLMRFIASQLVFIALTYLPRRYWRSNLA